MISPLYSTINVLYQLGTLIFLWIANKDMNDSFIPSSLLVDLHDPKRSLLKITGFACCRFFILAIEAAILVFVISVINQLYLRATKNHKKRKLIAGQTVRINVILNLFFIIVLIWGHFLAGLW